jgi:transcriptional regulator with XRE-family HTH domain
MKASAPDPVREAVAANLRALKARRRVTDQDIAKEIGVSDSAINDRMRGATACSATDLAKFALYFGVPVSYFFEAGDQRKQRSVCIPRSAGELARAA